MGFETIPDVINARSGTELMKERLVSMLDPSLTEDVQIVASRFRGLDGCKHRIFWAHDLEDDPESSHLADGGHQIYDALVFVSNWQMQNFIKKYNLPWSKCNVIRNAIVPIVPSKRIGEDEIRFIYHTTPHRGLEIALAVFDRLSHDFKNISLDVYSSYKIYGDQSRDNYYKNLFDFCKLHPQIRYHGTVPNNQIREALSNSDIYAYPCIWPETSCLSLIEAMSAGLICIHPNFGALFETSADLNIGYQWTENVHDHFEIMYALARDVVTNFDYSRGYKLNLNSKIYCDVIHNMERAAASWELLIKKIKKLPH